MDIHAIIFGATGHIGQGLLIECLGNPDVKSVLTIGRRPAGKQDAKLKEISHNDFTNFDALAEEMTGYNACFFCLGVSSAGMSEEKYHLITHDYAVSAAKVLSHQNPQMTFCFISGSGADETLQSRLMWARVKGKAENSLKALPFKAVYIFRPAYIQPVKGVKTTYKMYKVFGFFYPLWKVLFPNYVITTEILARAMIRAVEGKAPKQTLENKDIKALGSDSL